MSWLYIGGFEAQYFPTPGFYMIHKLMIPCSREQMRRDVSKYIYIYIIWITHWKIRSVCKLNCYLSRVWNSYFGKQYLFLEFYLTQYLANVSALMWHFWLCPTRVKFWNQPYTFNSTLDFHYSALQKNVINFDGNKACSTLEKCPFSSLPLRIIRMRKKK